MVGVVAPLAMPPHCPKGNHLTAEIKNKPASAVRLHEQLTLDSPVITERVARLTIEQKINLLTGADTWRSHAEPSIGLRPIVFSDGPAGVRGDTWDERSPSISLPSGTALASSWDPAVSRLYGNVIAAEARDKGVDVVLGPMVNLHRSPRGGRNFEAFSEDPRLTAEMAAAFVQGVQEMGVAAAPKHYVANDSETDRYTIDIKVDERTLHEVYLSAFEQAVTESRAWAIMSAYNSINGVTATESPLLRDPLKTEWGFDGVVVSDWTAVRSLAAAEAGQDLVMPGPTGPWGDALVRAVRAGQIPEDVIDDKVRRITLLAARVGALAGVGHQPNVNDVDGVAVAKMAAVEGAVLLKNDGALPLMPSRLNRVAVIGHHALLPRIQGGGSATVVPRSVTSPVEAIRNALPNQHVTHAMGAVVKTGITPIPLKNMVNPSTDEHGALVRFLGPDREELYREDRLATTLVYVAGSAPIQSARFLEVVFTYLPDREGNCRIGFSAVGSGEIYIAGELAASGTGVADTRDLGANLNQPPPVIAVLDAHANDAIEIRILFDLATRVIFPGHEGMFGIFIGTEPEELDPDALRAEAVREAAAADVAIVVVGTTSEIESEGFDRTDLALPGNQDDLVAAVAATGTPTIVVLNAGAPVLTPWRDDVAAILVSYFGGEQLAEALADVLIGAEEPGGRLTTTWPTTGKEALLPSIAPIGGELKYEEGLTVGYRKWLSVAADPAYPFGHGLGYTSWKITDVAVSAQQDFVQLEVFITNTGARAGKQVVQAYLSKEDSDIERPVKWLAGWGVARCSGAATTSSIIRVPRRSFEIRRDGRWFHEAGIYQMHIGTSIETLSVQLDILRP